MTGRISAETEQRLWTLSATMATAHHMGDDVQRELYGHMEDKLLAYLDGDEAVTEDDAFILVREHFGEPAVVKRLLHSVHPMKAGSHLLRRSVAMICAYMVFLALSDRLVMWNMLCLSQLTHIPAILLLLYPFMPPLLELTAVFLLWVLLRFWQRRVDDGRFVWFLEYPGWVLACVCLAVYAAERALPMAQVPPPPMTPTVDLLWKYYYPPVWLLATASSVGSFLMFIWWCDRPPRLWAPVLAACALWMGFMFLRVLSPLFLNILWGQLVAFPDAYFPAGIVGGQFGHLRSSAVSICACGTCSLAMYLAVRAFIRRRKRVA